MQTINVKLVVHSRDTTLLCSWEGAAEQEKKKQFGQSLHSIAGIDTEFLVFPSYFCYDFGQTVTAKIWLLTSLMLKKTKSLIGGLLPCCLTFINCTKTWCVAEKGAIIQGEIIYTPPLPPIFGWKTFFRGGGWGVYILSPHAARILYPPFYTPPNP